MNKKILISLLLLLVLAVLLWPEPAPEPVILVADPAATRTTASGPVTGATDADDTFAWLGIPFAAPPEGDLRWRAPRPPQSWQQPRETIAFRDPCIQIWGVLSGIPGGEAGQVVGSEDCLYLNIWAPRASSSADSAALPVMFWIHGGGNTIGTANTYPANRLAAEGDVVVVTINYRLGLLGWLSHPALRGKDRDALDASGNYANLDMIAALRWVQDNIREFGGDPDRVTIFGESAGGRNVYSLLASPLAQGLFHRAIAQSGSPRSAPRWRGENFADDTPRGHPNSSREWLAQRLVQAGTAATREEARQQLDAMSNSEVRDFMYGLSPTEIMAGLEGGAGMFPTPQSFRDGTVLPDANLREVFADPARHNSVPLMTGTNRDEMKLFLALSPKFVERRFGFLPRIRDEAAYNAVAGYLSDNWKAHAVDEVANIMAESGGQPVFAYRWDWDEGASNWLVDYSALLGAAHGLEVAYIFEDFEKGIAVPGLYNEENIPGRDLLAQQMRSYWTEFAYSGDPGQGRQGELPRWLAWGNGGPNLMLLDTVTGGGLRMATEPMTTAMLKERVTNGFFPDRESRCTMYAALFLGSEDGGDGWDQAGFESLGCGAYDPWLLEQVR
jgi:para-nitrobenzyl esterase